MVCIVRTVEHNVSNRITLTAAAPRVVVVVVVGFIECLSPLPNNTLSCGVSVRELGTQVTLSPPLLVWLRIGAPPSIDDALRALIMFGAVPR